MDRPATIEVIFEDGSLLNYPQGVSITTIYADGAARCKPGAILVNGITGMPCDVTQRLCSGAIL